MDGYNNRGTFAWGDPSAKDRRRVELVRSVLINSEGRDVLLPNSSVSTPGEYTFTLEEQQRNVTSLQLGSFVLGEDPRIAFDEQHTNFQISEPVHLDTVTSVSVQVVNDYFTITSSGSRVFASQTVDTDYIFVPPTNITVTAETQADTANGTASIFFPTDYSLTEAQFTKFERPTDAPPQLRATNLRMSTATTLTGPPVLIDTATSFGVVSVSMLRLDLDPGYNAYRTGGGEAVGNLDDTVDMQWNDFSAGPGVANWDYTLSSFSFPRYTLPQLAHAVDLQLADSGLGVRATISSVSGEFGMYLNSTETVLPGSVIRKSLVIGGVQDGDAFWHLGMGSYAAATTVSGGAAVVYPSSARTIQLPVASLSSASDLVDLLNRQTNPLFLSSTLTEEERTLVVHDVSGSVTSITYECGHYDPNFFASTTNYLLSVSSVTDVQCTFTGGNIVFQNSPTVSPTLSHYDFGIDFSSSQVLADILYYEPRMYFGSITTPVGQRLVSGFEASYDGNVRGLTRPVFWSVAPSLERRLVASSGVIGGPGAAGAFLSSVSLAADVNFLIGQVLVDPGDGTPIPWAHGLREGTRVAFYGTPPPGTLTTSLSTPFYGHVSSGGTADNPSFIEIFTSGAAARAFGTDVDNSQGDISISNAEPYPFFLDEQTDFVIHGNRVPRSVHFSSVDYTGALIGSGREYGPAESLIGMGATLLPSSGGALTLPRLFSLSPPSIVILELLEPSQKSVVHDYEAPPDRALPFTPLARQQRRPDGTSRILAVLVITNGFARISEEMTHVDSLGPFDVRKLHFRFLNPDMSVVDWRGQNHFLTLLTRQTMGRAQTNPQY